MVSLKVVLAGAGFDPEANHPYIREKVGAISGIPPNRGRPVKVAQGLRGEMAVHFPSDLCRLTALVGQLSL